MGMNISISSSTGGCPSSPFDLSASEKWFCSSSALHVSRERELPSERREKKNFADVLFVTEGVRRLLFIHTGFHSTFFFFPILFFFFLSSEEVPLYTGFGKTSPTFRCWRGRFRSRLVKRRSSSASTRRRRRSSNNNHTWQSRQRFFLKYRKKEREREKKVLTSLRCRRLEKKMFSSVSTDGPECNAERNAAAAVELTWGPRNWLSFAGMRLLLLSPLHFSLKCVYCLESRSFSSKWAKDGSNFLFMLDLVFFSSEPTGNTGRRRAFLGKRRGNCSNGEAILGLRIVCPYKNSFALENSTSILDIKSCIEWKNDQLKRSRERERR